MARRHIEEPLQLVLVERLHLVSLRAGNAHRLRDVAAEVVEQLPPRDLICDFFLGSGSTVIAAERTGRVCYGVEIDPNYASVVLARREAFTGEQAIRC